MNHSNHLKAGLIAVFLATLLFTHAAGAARETREQKQERLDAACEVAREEKLIPIRAEHVEECVARRQLPSREECTRFYADYGARAGGRAPLFYDLPECVEAFEFLQSARQRN